MKAALIDPDLSESGVDLASRPAGHSRDENVQRAGTRQREVALVFETESAQSRALMQGAFSYANAHANWTFSLGMPGHSASADKWLANWKGDGIIARVQTRSMARLLASSGLPVVDLTLGLFASGLPTVGADDAAIGRGAADHLMQGGFQSFAYCCSDRFRSSLRRGEAFRQALQEAGHDCCEFGSFCTAETSCTDRLDEISAWLRKLPKPTAVLASDDVCGQLVLEACRRAGLMTPKEIAVLGVGNDKFLCEMAAPPLSSVVPNANRTGYEAARLLDRLMCGESMSASETWIEPLGVERRQSTDILAVADPHVERALRFIREHVCDPVSIDEVARAAHMPRRHLERRFHRLIGRSLRKEILSIRLDHIKQLLTRTPLSLERIAEAMCYDHPEYLSVVFKREVGLSPREYRRQHVPGAVRAA